MDLKNLRRTISCYTLLVITLSYVLSACSTAPKNPGDIYELRRRAESQLDHGNKQAARGAFGDAMFRLDEALQMAIAADDPGLRIRAKLSRSNVLFSLDRGEEALEGWNEALSEAEKEGNKELIAVCRIHIGRAKLLSPDGKSAAQSVRDAANADLSLIKDRFYTAFAWTVVALAEKELGRYAGAESAARRSLEIHEKDRRLELAAYDWYMIASFRSLSGDYRGARQALESAIAFDRRVENSWGLANDWRALGDVQKKAGDNGAARAAYFRASEIFLAIGNEEAASGALARSP
jgi:tetratricopeptide (TPR) repeat protein